MTDIIRIVLAVLQGALLARIGWELGSTTLIKIWRSAVRATGSILEVFVMIWRSEGFDTAAAHTQISPDGGWLLDGNKKKGRQLPLTMVACAFVGVIAIIRGISG